jgi:tripartite-type tricarboxylate transporter receptor subunit TctC
VKANPGKVNMASSGNGTSVHLSGEMFMAMSGTKMQHVPYRGAAPAITDMLGGQVQVIFDNMPSIIQHIRAGSLRALGVTTAARSPLLPDVATVAETVPGYEAAVSFGLFARKGTPREILVKINADIQKVINDPEFHKRFLEALVVQPLPGSLEAFAEYLHKDSVKWAKVINAANLKID